jgi:hypothetical protein
MSVGEQCREHQVDDVLLTDHYLPNTVEKGLSRWRERFKERHIVVHSSSALRLLVHQFFVVPSLERPVLLWDVAFHAFEQCTTVFFRRSEFFGPWNLNLPATRLGSRTVTTTRLVTLTLLFAALTLLAFALTLTLLTTALLARALGGLLHGLLESFTRLGNALCCCTL